MVAVDLVIGAAIFVAGVGLGRVWRPRPRRRPELLTQPQCGCGHHYSMHDPETHRCHAMAEVGAQSWSPSGPRLIPCGCRTYTGPQPLPEFVATTLSA